MLNLGSEKIVVDRKDGWTVRTRDGAWSAHFEHMILITENEPEILTWQKMMCSE
jgi:methionyl aminopeptidase